MREPFSKRENDPTTTTTTTTTKIYQKKNWNGKRFPNSATPGVDAFHQTTPPAAVDATENGKKTAQKKTLETLRHRFHFLWLSLTGFYRVFMGFIKVIESSTVLFRDGNGSLKIFLDFTGFFKFFFIEGVVRLNSVLFLDSTEVYRVLPGFYGIHFSYRVIYCLISRW